MFKRGRCRLRSSRAARLMTNAVADVHHSLPPSPSAASPNKSGKAGARAPPMSTDSCQKAKSGFKVRSERGRRLRGSSY